MADKQPAITLAAGIFFPDVGGPAIHVRKIADYLAAHGWHVTVVAYGEPMDDGSPYAVHRISRTYSKPMQWLRYLVTLARVSRESAIVYAFDPTAAGIPAFLVARFFGKKFFMRIGGDPIWERVVEKGERFLSITDYYKQGLHLKDRPTLFHIIRFVARRADRIIVYNNYFKDFYHRYFDVPESVFRVILNPVFRREPATEVMPADPTILFAGRFVAYKNLPLVIRAVARARAALGYGRLRLVGKGPDEAQLRDVIRAQHAESFVSIEPSVPQEQLFQRIKDAAISIAPALTEFNPNFILESLSFGKPVMLSKGNGLSVQLPEQFLFDPMSEDELVQKLTHLLSPDNYAQAVRDIAALPLNISWDDVTAQHLKLIETFGG